MEDITDLDQNQEKSVCRDLKVENVGEYHNLYLKSDTLLVVDVFENFRKMCLEIYKLNPAKFILASELS